MKTTAERLRSAVEMKESEQVKLLKQQINDLQNVICERDARACVQRTRVRTLETDNEKLTVGICSAVFVNYGPCRGNWPSATHNSTVLRRSWSS